MRYDLILLKMPTGINVKREWIMKKTFKFLSLICIILIASTFLFTACKKDDPVDDNKTVDTPPSVQPHIHTEVVDDAVEPTCNKTGLTEGKHCSECGEVILAQTVVPLKEHTYKDNVCNWCCAIDLDSTEDAYVICDSNGTPNENGEYILFGEYPQSIKQKNVTITKTVDSRGYFLGSDGSYYAAVTATPYGEDYKFTSGAAIKNGEVYYFKVEPIRWRILSLDGKIAFILCDSILSNMSYQTDFYGNNPYYTGANDAPNGTVANNYEYSAIRKWLNETFYETAFADFQKEIIVETQVDNSAKSTNPYGNEKCWNDGENGYICSDTLDNIFLLSEEDVTNPKYGFLTVYEECDKARIVLTSDYSRAIGTFMNTEKTYYGNSYWWLRSPNCDYSMSRVVNLDGNAHHNFNVNVDYVGVIPAMYIDLTIKTYSHTPLEAVEENHKDPTCTNTGSYDVVVYCSALGCQKELSRETQTISALGHNVTKVTVVPPTCTAKGYTKHECTRCSYYEKDEESYVDALGHDLTKVTVIPPTCTTQGYTKHACTRCSYYEKDEESYVDALGHDYSKGTCTRCALQVYVVCDKYGVENAEGDYILFGEYPQSIKKGNVTVSGAANSNGYYRGSDGCYYAKVVATPHSKTYTFSTEEAVVDGSEYYFKVEPIRWRILTASNGTALILCDSIIANQRYDDSSNNYEQSEVRQWLNETFYNTAFTELQREMIVATWVDNSAASTGNITNGNASNYTEDNLFLLSYAEVMNSEYGFSYAEGEFCEELKMLTSDYSRATGVYMNTDSEYYGNGYWMLRSPYYRNGKDICGVGSYGFVYYIDDADSNRYGVVPALWIKF